MAPNPADDRDDASYDDAMRVEDGVVRPPGSGFAPGQTQGADHRGDPELNVDSDGEDGDDAPGGDA